MELSQNLSIKLSTLKDKNGNQIEFQNVESVIEDIVSLFKSHVNGLDNELMSELKGIGDKVTEARMEFANDTEKKDTIIESAASELDAVIESTEEATDKILDSAENIQKIVSQNNDNDMSKGITDNVMIIFEACNFQDITGQRIKKISKALDFIEASVGHILARYSYDDINNDTRKDSRLMDGPQASQNKPDQDEVDKLFDSV